MRHSGAEPLQETIVTSARATAIAVLTISLVLSLLPLMSGPALAAPPEPERAVSGDDPAIAERDSPDVPLAGIPEETRQERSAREHGENRAAPGSDRTVAGSVRPRGREAPVQLRQAAPEQPETTERDAAADPGDGPPPKPRDATGDRRSGSNRKSNQDARLPRGTRIWPMKAGSYTFSQAFGCVPQIAHFYRPGTGCPADAPVIHHGIDLAAPEGTPFYAAASGWVTESGYDREVGVANTRIIIQHEGRNQDYATEYLHWIASYVEVGDYVEAGEVIGEVGSVGYSTGPHLHFSVIDLETGGNLDPVSWLPDEAGNEGYRGRQPNMKATMRLPAGTTAGVPEFADPSPPPPPERVEVPESRVDHQGRDRSERQRKRDRKERRATKESANAGRDAGRGDGTAAKAPSGGKTEKQGKNRERVRKRERNKNGQTSAKRARGESDSGRKRDKNKQSKTFETRAKPSNKERRDSRAGKREAPKEKPVDQRETNRRNDKKKEKRDQSVDEAPPAELAGTAGDGAGDGNGGASPDGSGSGKDRGSGQGRDRANRGEHKQGTRGDDPGGAERRRSRDQGDAGGSTEGEGTLAGEEGGAGETGSAAAADAGAGATSPGRKTRERGETSRKTG